MVRVFIGMNKEEIWPGVINGRPEHAPSSRKVVQVMNNIAYRGFLIKGLNAGGV